MPKLEDVRITDTMAKAGLLYEEGQNAAEVAAKLGRTSEYILWSLRVQGISVDEAKLSPNGKAGRQFIREWDKVTSMWRKILCVLLIAVMVWPMPAEAQTKIPAKVEKALDRAVNENGRAIIIAGDRIYLFKQCKGKWKLKKTGRCVVSEKLRKTRHYVLMRDDDYDTLMWGTEYKRWAYGMIIDCYERPESILIHSYTEKYTGRTWVKDKSRAGNDFGIAVCEELAEHIWKHYGDGTAVMGV